jgi:3-isopropylmalate dehydrogenase
MYNIAVLPGDGIGPEIVESALQVLDALQLDVAWTKYNFGGAGIDNEGDPLPETTLRGCLDSQAILLGAIGGPQYNDCPRRPETGLLELRQKLQLFANLRPVKVFNSLISRSPLKPEIVKGVDFVIVRELVSGIYFGEHNLKENEASDICYYSKQEIERIAELGFDIATKRSTARVIPAKAGIQTTGASSSNGIVKKPVLTSVDKQNVLATSKLWRATVSEIGEKYPEVELEHQLVDSMAMMIVSNPSKYDVVITENMFGDILSDEASMITGSIGLMPSSSISVSGPNLYEPIHGSAPDIAGQNIANPIGTILSLSMLLQDLGLINSEIDDAVERVINSGKLTKDLGGELTTTEITAAIIQNLELQNLRLPRRFASRNDETGEITTAVLQELGNIPLRSEGVAASADGVVKGANNE